MQTTYERYVGILPEMDETEIDLPQYVKDKEGNLHNLTGDIKLKLSKVATSRDYWKKELEKDEVDARAKKFYNNFNYLYNQILLFLNKNGEVIVN